MCQMQKRPRTLRGRDCCPPLMEARKVTLREVGQLVQDATAVTGRMARASPRHPERGEDAPG